MRRIALVPLVALALAGIGYAGVSVTHAQQRHVALADIAGDSAQWVMPSQGYANLRHSGLTEIKTDNIGGMKAAWTMSSGAT
ncbi:MAG: hypothetical protein JWO66_1074, partial [Candidatus Eremiobacteraeota bacterium]|nr:hypothetical protein [Candidatus Eremiobacteraeota bacterium]